MGRYLMNEKFILVKWIFIWSDFTINNLIIDLNL